MMGKTKEIEMDTYKTVCNKCYRKTWYETEQPCHCTRFENGEEVPCGGTLKVIDNSQLDPRFTHFHETGERIEITYKNGEKIRCYIGKSTGWKPIYLEIKKSNSSGGGSLMTQGIVSIRGLGKKR